jgi:hypothetical protein
MLINYAAIVSLMQYDSLFLQLERFEVAFDSIKKQLFGQLHNVLKNQLVGGVIATKGNLSQGFVDSSLKNRSSKLQAILNYSGSRVERKYDIVSLNFEPNLKKSTELD